MTQIVKMILPVMICSFAASQNIAAETDSDRLIETYLESLYDCTNPADKADRSRQFYIENAVKPALQARDEMPWGSTVPEREFRYFVLPLRVNNEAIDAHRPAFYAELRDRVKGLPMKDAILEINHWCHEKATYQPSDARTHSPLQTVSSAIGRCGEESTFAVAALRAMGIPARQVYTPRWAHTDDNHAWVEAWADGRWYFLGACEPEPVLNLGWFNAPAARGMLMHARVPGNTYDGPEEVLARMNGNTDINVTANYAPVDTLTVEVTDKAGRPVPDAEVSFRIYNYAEFYPLVTKTTDSNGISQIVAGLGDMLVWATDGNSFGFSECKIGDDSNITIRLEHDPTTTLSADFDITPPRPRTADVTVSPEMRAHNDLRMLSEDSIRNVYTSTFVTRDASDLLADSLGIEPQRLWGVMSKSRGNHSVITGFLFSVDQQLRDRAVMLLESVSEKDLTDITPEVLADHILAPFTGSPLYAQYVLSPRITAEELTPFRSIFLRDFSTEEVADFAADPQKWMKYVADSIKTTLDWYPSQATMSPAAVLRDKTTSALSRDIFFVAGARSFGIPARIDPVTLKTQWADADGKWHDATFSTTADSKQNPHSTPQGTLRFDYKPTRAVADPKYYSHFTISRIANGRPQLLNYPDFIPLSQSFQKPEAIDCGQYMIVTGQRMADGSVMTHVDIITVDEGDNTLNLKVREDPSGIEVLGTFDSESRYLPTGATEPRSLLSTTGRGYYALCLLKPNHEPSNHALRDLAAEADALQAWQRPVILLYDSEESIGRVDMSGMPQLPSGVTVGSDIDDTIRDKIANAFTVSENDYPVMIIADTFNRVVFISKGYAIGLGRRIADVISRLE